MELIDTQKEMLYWFVVILLPILIGVFTLYHKQIKDNKSAENRLTKIESQQDQNTKTIEKIEQEQFIVREELKTVKSIDQKQDMMYDMLKDLKNQLKGSDI